MADPRKPYDPDDELDDLEEAPPASDSLDEPPSAGDELDEEALPSDGAPSDEARGLGAGVSEVLRKAMVAGLGAVFMTEEGIRTLVKDLKLPKDAVGFVLGQAEKSKDELMRIIGEEMRRFFESAALRRELIKLLSEVTIEVKAEIRLQPESRQPEVRVATTTARRSKKKG